MLVEGDSRYWAGVSPSQGRVSPKDAEGGWGQGREPIETEHLGAGVGSFPSLSFPSLVSKY